MRESEVVVAGAFNLSGSQFTHLGKGSNNSFLADELLKGIRSSKQGVQYIVDTILIL